MSWVKLYFEVNKEILLIATVFNITSNAFIHPNLIKFVSSFIGLVLATIIVFMAVTLYFWIRYELPSKIKILALKLKLFWQFMNYTEDEVKIFKLFVDKVKKSYERSEKQ